MADSPTPLSSVKSDVYREDFMKRHYHPLKERLDAKGLAQASQALDDLIWQLVTGPEVGLLLAEDCLTAMSAPDPPADAAIPVRGFLSSLLAQQTGQLAMEGAIRTLHCSGDFFGRMLNTAGLVSSLLEDDYHAFDVLKALPKRSRVKRAFGDFLNSAEYKHVAAATNEMKHRQRVRTTYYVQKPIGQPAQATFYLESFERDEVTYPETDPMALRRIIDEFRKRGSALMDEALATLA